MAALAAETTRFALLNCIALHRVRSATYVYDGLFGLAHAQPRRETTTCCASVSPNKLLSVTAFNPISYLILYYISMGSETPTRCTLASAERAQRPILRSKVYSILILKLAHRGESTVWMLINYSSHKLELVYYKYMQYCTHCTWLAGASQKCSPVITCILATHPRSGSFPEMQPRDHMHSGSPAQRDLPNNAAP